MSTTDSPESPDESKDPSGDLLARWQKSGDLDALDALLAIEITRLKARIRAQVGYMTDPAASASDVAQEAVFRLIRLEKGPQFDNPQALRAYLWTTAWRLLVGRLRSAGNAVTHFDPTLSGSLGSQLATTGGIDSVEERDMSAAMGLAVNLLEPVDQEILTLVYMRCHDIEDAAIELGVSRDAANMRLVRARRSLGKKLLRWGEVIG